MDFNIRRANGLDAKAITSLRHRSWLSAYVNEKIATKEEIDKQFLAQLGDENRMAELAEYFDADKHNCFVAEKDGSLLGIVWLNDFDPNADIAKQPCRMWGLYIDPAVQKNHIGTKLWQFALSKAKQMGYKKLELDTPLFNTNAVTFYEKKGCKKNKTYMDEMVVGKQTDFVEYEILL